MRFFGSTGSIEGAVAAGVRVAGRLVGFVTETEDFGMGEDIPVVFAGPGGRQALRTRIPKIQKAFNRSQNLLKKVFLQGIVEQTSKSSAS